MRTHEGRGRLRGLRRRGRSPLSLDDQTASPAERAVARFNSSEAGRAVVGLTRTLGVPRASLGASAGVPGEMRVTIAWELCWYQWGVDVGEERRPVREIGKGTEVEQLDSAARQWNALVTADGRLRLAGARAASR